MTDIGAPTRRMSALVDRIGRIGIDADLPTREARTARLINLVTVVWIGLSLVFMPLVWVSGGIEGLVVQVAVMLFASAVILLHQRKRYRAARHYFILNLLVLVGAANIAFGPREQLQFIMIVFLALLVFRRRTPRTLYLLATLAVFISVSLFQWQNPERYIYSYQEQMVDTVVSIGILAFAFLLPILLYHLATEQQASQELMEKNRILAARETALLQTSRELENALKKEQEMSEALADQERQVRRLVDNMKEGLVTLDGSGRITYANRSLLEMFDYRLEEITGRSPVDFLPEQERSRFIEQFTARKQGVVLPYEIDWRKRDGSTFSSLVSPQPLFEESGLFSGSVAVITDVTPIKQAQLAVEQREAQIRAIFSSAAVGFAVLDDYGRLTRVNEHLAQLLGYSQEELLHMRYLDLIVEEDREQVEKAVERLFKGKVDEPVVERRYRRKDGSILFGLLSPSPLRNENGEVRAAITSVVDISERKATELALHKSEKHYRELVNYARSIILRWDASGLIRFVNPYGLAFFGFEADDLLGRHVVGTIVPESDSAGRDLAQMIRELTLDPDRFLYNENEMQDREGRRYWVVWTNRPITDAGGKVVEILSIGTDITTLKKAETALEQQRDDLRQLNTRLEKQNEEILAKSRQLQEANQRLQQKTEELAGALDRLGKTQTQLAESAKMASLGQLTAGIAHEINNPINYVSSSIAPLRRDLDDVRDLLERIESLDANADTREALQELLDYARTIDLDVLWDEMANLMAGIEDGARRTKEIVAGLRNFSRMDEDEFKEADVHDGIESTLTLLHNRTKRTIEIHRDFTADGTIDCLPGKLNQVFMNLLVNAIQAIESRGPESTGHIWIRTWTESNVLMISIRDDGIGMDEATRDRIFEPFFTTKAIGEGTGLGLSIVQGILDAHRATLDIETDPGKGSTFTVGIRRDVYRDRANEALRGEE